jgi:glycerol uptake facilitator-like aquaporin
VNAVAGVSVRAVEAQPSLRRRLAAEGLGSFFLFLAVIGSGIMAERLSGGNHAVALLANSLATGAMLFVLILILGPISGGHMNPAVTLVAAIRRELGWREAAAYIGAQLAFGICAAWAAHLMFDLPALQLSGKARSGTGQWLGEAIATFGLIVTIIGAVRRGPQWVPGAVALYITGAYWFTSSTSFANPAITIVRSLTDSFTGIAPRDVPMFVLAQFAGAAAGAVAAHGLFPKQERGAQPLPPAFG